MTIKRKLIYLSIFLAICSVVIVSANLATYFKQLKMLEIPTLQLEEVEDGYYLAGTNVDNGLEILIMLSVKDHAINKTKMISNGSKKILNGIADILDFLMENNSLDINFIVIDAFTTNVIIEIIERALKSEKYELESLPPLFMD